MQFSSNADLDITLFEMHTVDSVYVSNEPEKLYVKKLAEHPDGRLKLVKKRLKKVFIKSKAVENLTKSEPENSKTRTKTTRKNDTSPEANGISAKLAKLKQHSGALFFVLIAVFAFAGSTVGFLNCEDGKRKPC